MENKGGLVKPRRDGTFQGTPLEAYLHSKAAPLFSQAGALFRRTPGEFQGFALFPERVSKGAPWFADADPWERLGLSTPTKFFVFELNFDPVAGSKDHLKVVSIEPSQQPHQLGK